MRAERLEDQALAFGGGEGLARRLKDLTADRSDAA